MRAPPDDVTKGKILEQVRSGNISVADAINNVMYATPPVMYATPPVMYATPPPPKSAYFTPTGTKKKRLNEVV